ncbi:MAG: CDP-alcohol phosphatidyltransferase family protein [Actinomycetota bacterium]
MDRCEAKIRREEILTVPNVLSAVRLAGVPLFLWLILTKHDGWAFAVLAFAGVTDYLDGKIARRYGWTSRLGELLDPAADRLYIVCTLIGLAIRGIIPWWLVAVLLAREIFLAGLLGVLRRRGHGPLAVNFIGKAATFNLLYAFPLVLLGEGESAIHDAARTLGWAFIWWGVFLYWSAAVLYVQQGVILLRQDDDSDRHPAAQQTDRP